MSEDEHFLYANNYQRTILHDCMYLGTMDWSHCEIFQSKDPGPYRNTRYISHVVWNYEAIRSLVDLSDRYRLPESPSDYSEQDVAFDTMKRAVQFIDRMYRKYPTEDLHFVLLTVHNPPLLEPIRTR